jgi:hypothetical protein
VSAACQQYNALHQFTGDDEQQGVEPTLAGLTRHRHRDSGVISHHLDADHRHRPGDSS